MMAKVNEITKKMSKNELRQVKPSTERVADEYDVLFDGRECIHIFVSKEDLGTEYVKFLKTVNIEVPERNVHLMQSDDQIESILKEVSDSLDDISALIMLFWGYSMQEGKFILDDESTLPYYQIWTPFLTNDAVMFRDIPKVFLFNVIKSEKVEFTDGVLLDAKVSSPYEKPNEADLLIIYKHNEDDEESIGFIQELADRLKEYGKQEDLCSILSIIDTEHFTRPIIISTLLKKFYMIPSKLRSYYLNFEVNYELISSELMKIEEILIEAQKEKQHESPSLLRRMKKTLSSFRNKGTNNRETLKQDSTVKSKRSTKSSTTEPEYSKDSIPDAPRTSASGEKPLPRNSIGKIPVRKVSKAETLKVPWKP